MEFLGDQGRDVVIARDFLKNGNLFFIGPQTSIGNIYLGPYYYYFFVVPGLLIANFNPIGPAIIIALLGVSTVLLIFLVSRQWFNLKVAYIASFLYAISPVVIKYSNFSWNPNIMPFFALLFIYSIINSRYILASLSFILCLNSHFLALLLIPTAFIILIFQYLKNKSIIKQKSINLLLAIIIFIISLTPQILFDIKHQGQNINSFISFFKYRETTINLKPYKALPLLPQLFNQVNTRLLTGKNEKVGVFISLLFAILLTIEIYRQFKVKRIDTNFFFLLLWLTVGIIGLGLYKQHIYDHYFGFIYPPVFIIFAYLIQKQSKILLTILILIVTLFSLLENPLRWEPPKQLDTTNKITQSIINESQNKPFNFALLAKMNYDPGYRYLFYQSNASIYLLRDKLTDQLFVVCEPFQIDCNPINNPFWDVAAFGWAKIDKQWEINGIKIFKLLHTQT